MASNTNFDARTLRTINKAYDLFGVVEKFFLAKHKEDYFRRRQRKLGKDVVTDADILRVTKDVQQAFHDVLQHMTRETWTYLLCLLDKENGKVQKEANIEDVD